MRVFLLYFSKTVLVTEDKFPIIFFQHFDLVSCFLERRQFLKNIDEKISSTTIRTFIKRNESYKEYLNKNVYTYILKNKMYL